jgi:hypothetical protein
MPGEEQLRQILQQGAEDIEELLEEQLLHLLEEQMQQHQRLQQLEEGVLKLIEEQRRKQLQLQPKLRQLQLRQKLESFKGDFSDLANADERYEKLLEKLDDNNIVPVLMAYIDVSRDSGEAPNLQGVNFANAIRDFLDQIGAMEDEYSGQKTRCIDITQEYQYYLNTLFLAAKKDKNFTCLDLENLDALTIEGLSFLLSPLADNTNITNLSLVYLCIDDDEVVKLLFDDDRLFKSKIKTLLLGGNCIVKKETLEKLFTVLPATVTYLDVDVPNSIGEENSFEIFKKLPDHVESLVLSMNDDNGIYTKRDFEVMSEFPKNIKNLKLEGDGIDEGCEDVLAQLQETFDKFDLTEIPNAEVYSKPCDSVSNRGANEHPPLSIVSSTAQHSASVGNVLSGVRITAERCNTGENERGRGPFPGH